MKSTVNTRLIETVNELRAWRSQFAERFGAGKGRLGFVPTMGALHPGHMSLVEAALKECDHVIVSIFVNPLQFGQGEDFNRYPRPFEKDMEFCRAAGVHTVFHPSIEQMYPQGQEGLTRVVPPRHLIRHLCGAFRPGHFEGVATVVCKLFGMVKPHRAYFGEKDYQQLVVIRQMVRDLNLPVTIVPAPTYREPDGLAMSSRNVYLDQGQRRLAPELHKALCFVADQASSGQMSLSEALAGGRDKIAALPGVTLQYLEACNPVSLEPLVSFARPMVILGAAKFGEVRLIDNVIVG